MLTKDYCDFETAKLLKEKGFDIPCNNYYDSSGKTPNESIYGETYIETLDYNADPFVKSGFPKFKTFSAPTLQMVMKYLREVHNIYIEVSISCNREDKNAKIFDASIFNIENQRYKKFCNIQGYEQACENSIKYCLENLI